MADDVNYAVKANEKSVNGEVPEGASLGSLLSENVDEMQAKVDGTLVVAVQIVRYFKLEIGQGQNLVETALGVLDDCAVPFDCSVNISMNVEGKVNVTQMADADWKALSVDPDVKLESREMPAIEAISPGPIIIPPKKLG